MNKKEINTIKKEFKANSSVLKIKEVYSVYLKKDNNEVIHSEVGYFEAMVAEEQELYFTNFKKLLGGTLDTKLFQLEFQKNEDNEVASEVLQNILEAQDSRGFTESSDRLVKDIGDNFKYDTDVVITFTRGEYWKGSKNRKNRENSELATPFNFILATINSIELPKNAIRFDFALKKFVAGARLEFTVNHGAPLEGIFFPVLSNGYTDVNSILYYSGKPKLMNSEFIREVFHCNFPVTAKDEWESFNEILNISAPGKITTSAMQHIYEELNERMKEAEDEEDEVLNAGTLKSVIEGSGIGDINGIEEAFEEVTGSKGYEFKIKNIIPDFNTKSVKILSSQAEINITPSELNTIRQVRDENGHRCIMMELDEDFSINGLMIKEKANA